MPDTWIDEHVDFDVTVRDPFVDDLEGTLVAAWHDAPETNDVELRIRSAQTQRRWYRPLGWVAAVAAVAAGSLALVTSREHGAAPADTVTTVPEATVDPLVDRINAARVGLAAFLDVHSPSNPDGGPVNLDGCFGLTVDQVNAAISAVGLNQQVETLATEVEWNEADGANPLSIVCFGDDGAGFDVTLVVKDLGADPPADSFMRLADLASMEPVQRSIVDGDQFARGCRPWDDGVSCGVLWEFHGFVVWLRTRSPEALPDESELLFDELFDDVLGALATVDPAAFDAGWANEAAEVLAARDGLQRATEGVTAESPRYVDGSCPVVEPTRVEAAMSPLRFAGTDLGGWHADIEVDEFAPGVPGIECYADADGDPQDADDELRTDILLFDFGSPVPAQEWLDNLAVENVARVTWTGIAPEDELIGWCDQGDIYLECTALWEWDGLVVGLSLRAQAGQVDQLSTVALLQALLPDVFSSVAEL